jgi:hypothetical protein
MGSSAFRIRLLLFLPDQHRTLDKLIQGAGAVCRERPQEKPITYVPVNEIPKEQAAEETPAPPPVATPDAPTAVASGVGETASATSRAGETAREDHHRHSN